MNYRSPSADLWSTLSEHFQTAGRCFERNALKEKADGYHRGSLANQLVSPFALTIATWPVRKLPGWIERINMALTEIERSAIR